MITRRQFVLKVVPSSALLLGVNRNGQAQAAQLQESDALAVSLGYKHDASKVDAKKYPSFASGRNCANCQLFQAKASEPWAACAISGGKLVNAKGWCTAWAKKA